MARRSYGRISFSVDIQEEADSLGVGDGVARFNHVLAVAVELAAGLGDAQIDRVHSMNGTASNTPTDIDLSGSLTSPLNANTNIFTEISGIAIYNTGSVNLRVGGDAAGIPLMSDPSD